MIYVLGAMLSLLIGQLIVTYGFGNYAPFFVVVIIYALGTLFCALFYAFNKSLRVRISKMIKIGKPLLWLLMIMALNAFAFFYAIYLIGISGISTLANISTMAIILGGVYWYKESLNIPKILLIGLTLISAVLFGFSETVFDANKVGIALAIFAGLSWAAIHFMMKNISESLGGLPFSIIRTPFLFVFFLGVYLLLPSAFFEDGVSDFSALKAFDIFLFSLSALSMTIITYAFMPLSMRYADLSTIAIVNASRPMLAFFVGITLFAEPIDDFKIIAAILGLSGGLLYSVYIFYESRQKAKAIRLKRQG